MVQLKVLEEKIFKRTELASLPDKFKGKVTHQEVRPDARNKEALYLTIELADKDDAGEKQTIKQKYTKMHFAELTQAMEAMKLKDTESMVGVNFVWSRIGFKMGNHRWVPVEIVK
jgi:hypothetical protein